MLHIAEPNDQNGRQPLFTPAAVPLSVWFLDGESRHRRYALPVVGFLTVTSPHSGVVDRHDTTTQPAVIGPRQSVRDRLHAVTVDDYTEYVTLYVTAAVAVLPSGSEPTDEQWAAAEGLLADEIERLERTP